MTLKERADLFEKLINDKMYVGEARKKVTEGLTYLGRGSFATAYTDGFNCLKLSIDRYGIRNQYTLEEIDILRPTKDVIKELRRKHYLGLTYITPRKLAATQHLVDCSYNSINYALKYFCQVYNDAFINHGGNVGIYRTKPVIFDWE